jgi:hypothetical protein
MAVTINASTTTGLVQSADTSGIIELQSNGTTALTVNTNEGIKILNCLGVGNATPSTSGAGITFPATQSASTDANTLDDYEEGTWTPNVGGTATYTFQEGVYTKIGNTVFVRGQIIINSIGTGAVNNIGGLPFSAPKESSIPLNKLTNSAFSFYFATLRTSGTDLYLSGQDSLDASIGLNQTFLQNSTEVQFSGFYYVS